MLNSYFEHFEPIDDCELEQIEFYANANWQIRRLQAAVRLRLHNSMHHNIPDEELHRDDSSLYWHALHAVIRESTDPAIIQMNRQIGQQRRIARNALQTLLKLRECRPQPIAPAQPEDQSQEIKNEPVEALTPAKSIPARATAGKIRARFGLSPISAAPPDCPVVAYTFRKEAASASARPAQPERVQTVAA
jgi:hypothetical protein